jgi:methylated-DNA-[protein]-cysteine S-methyltransferase
MKELFYTPVQTPLGTLQLAGTEEAITELRFPSERDRARLEERAVRRDELFRDACRQLTEYFEGKRTRFRLKLRPEGTAFQKACWNLLIEIPYGETITYGEQARRLGKPAACRAVGAANGKNPIPILIPCHRVIGKGGGLTGYGGGIDVKRRLLDLEKRLVRASPA